MPPAEIWEKVKAKRYSNRDRVNIIRHKHTSYDLDRKTGDPIEAFKKANQWIADNFPQLEHEAMAQIKDREDKPIDLWTSESQ